MIQSALTSSGCQVLRDLISALLNVYGLLQARSHSCRNASTMIAMRNCSRPVIVLYQCLCSHLTNLAEQIPFDHCMSGQTMRTGAIAVQSVLMAQCHARSKGMLRYEHYD